MEDLYAELRDGPLAGVRVDMLHGQLPAEEKEAVMARFVAGEIDVLVATTVIEVGVDVPNASVMVISDADRFGISQLHQLRGRIGRGGHPGVCLLLTTAEAGSLARQRLDAVAGTRDGFALAEVDLIQRREGDVLGASQSGSRSSLKLLRVLDDADLLLSARELAERCIADDPELSDPALADIVTELETEAAGDWLERTSDRSRSERRGCRLRERARTRRSGSASRDPESIVRGRRAAAGSACRPVGTPGRPPTGYARRSSPPWPPGPAPPTGRRRRPWPAWPSPTCTPAPARSGWRPPAGARTPVLLVEQDRATAQLVRRNAADLGLPVTVRPGDVRALLRRPAEARFDVVFADPPYDVPTPVIEELLADLDAQGWLNRSAPGHGRAVPADAGAGLAGLRPRDLEPGLR